MERVTPPLVITFKLAVDSVSSNHIFVLFLFLFNSHYLKKSVHGPGPKPFYKNKIVSMDLVHDRGSMERVQKWGFMHPWSMFCPLDPKQSQDRVFKFKLSHRSFSSWLTGWLADLCEFGGNFCGGSAIQRVHEWRPPKFSPNRPCHGCSGKNMTCKLKLQNKGIVPKNFGGVPVLKFLQRLVLDFPYIYLYFLLGLLTDKCIEKFKKWF